jgi:hypothetical protein
MTNAIVKRPAPPRDPREEYIRAMWLRFLLAPGRKTAPGEPVDLGEVGSVRLKDQCLNRDTPYSVCRGIRDNGESCR